jgi:chorismate synthase
MRVAAGAIARKVLAGVTIRGALVQIGPHKVDRANWDWDEIGNNPFFCPDATRRNAGRTISTHPQGGSSVGAVIEVVAEACRPGLARRSMASSMAIWPQR